MADCVVVEKALPEFGEQPFSNVMVDEQSLHAATVLKAHTLGDKIDLKALRRSMGTGGGRQVVVLSREQIQDGDLLFRLNGSKLYMRYRKNAVNLFCPLERQHSAASRSTAPGSDTAINDIATESTMRFLRPSAVEKLQKTTTGGLASFYDSDASKTLIIGGSVDWLEQVARAKETRAVIENVSRLFGYDQNALFFEQSLATPVVSPGEFGFILQSRTNNLRNRP